MNGTSGGDLLDQVCNAAYALEEAMVTMRQAAPNARDYYVQDDGAFAVANGEHLARLVKLESVVAEYNTMAKSIADAIGLEAAALAERAAEAAEEAEAAWAERAAADAAEEAQAAAWARASRASRAAWAAWIVLVKRAG